jgi:hypothetical protein
MRIISMQDGGRSGRTRFLRLRDAIAVQSEAIDFRSGFFHELGVDLAAIRGTLSAPH